jgi:hypothetical protein
MEIRVKNNLNGYLYQNIVLPIPVPRRKTGGSCPSDSDLTLDDQLRKDLTYVGVFRTGRILIVQC